MTQTIEAVFENGVFRLLNTPAVPIPQGQHVRLHVETDDGDEDILALAGRVYDALSPEEITEIEQIAGHRQDFFGEREAS